MKKNYFSLLILLSLISSAIYSTERINQRDHFSYLHVPYEIKLEVLGGSSYEIIDISKSIEEWPATGTPDLNVVDASEIYSVGTVFFGFGKPNVYMARITEEKKLSKVDAKSLKRKPTQIVETDGRTQSGLHFIPRNISEETIQNIIEISEKHVGTSHYTCVNANSRILHEAGFTLGNGEELKEIYLPNTLLKKVLKHGMMIDGERIDFDIVRTTKAPLKDLDSEIKTAVNKTPLRHAGRCTDSEEKKAYRKELAAPIRERNSEVSKLGPSDEEQGKYFRIAVSEPSSVGNFLRSWWSAHVIYKILINPIHISTFLPTTLHAFPEENPSWATSIKKRFLFSRPVVRAIRSQMTSTFKEMPSYCEKDFLHMIEAHSEDNPHIYNFVVTDKEIVIAQLEVKYSVVDWILSKHVLLSEYSNSVHFAGEFWKDENNELWFNRNSGTYKPTEEQLESFASLLRQLFDVVKVHTESSEG